MAFTLVKNFKWTPKTIAVAAGAVTLAVGAFAFVKWGIPAIFGNKTGELHLNMTAELDCTDAAAEALSDAIGSKVRCTGEVIATFNLTMDEGEYTMELDRKDLDAQLEDFVFENADGILKAQLAAAGQATDAAALNEYAVTIGYADWNAAVNATADSLMSGSFERDTEGDIAFEGTYTIETDKKGIMLASYLDGKDVAFTGEYDPSVKGVVYVDFSFDKKSPSFLYDYFNRGVELEFSKGSGKSDNRESRGGANSGISVNFILDTVATTTTEETTTEETTTETTPPPTTQATAIVTDGDGTPVTNGDGTPVTEVVNTDPAVNPTETAAVVEG